METPNIGMLTRIAAEFIPLGYQRRRKRVVFYNALLDRQPDKFIVSNLALVGLIIAYDHIHQGADWWGHVHTALAMPSVTIFSLALASKTIKMLPKA